MAVQVLVRPLPSSPLVERQVEVEEPETGKPEEDQEGQVSYCPALKPYQDGAVMQRRAVEVEIPWVVLVMG